MNYNIQIIEPQYDAKIRNIIKKVGEEFGAIGEGFGPSDPEVEAMSEHYKDIHSSQYLVASINGEIVGGCGIAPFNCRHDICELRKLFLLPEGRGVGLGKRLTEACLAYAKRKGYKACYLDTLKSMTSAVSLYEKLGFQHLDKPLAGTMHNGCDCWMLKEL